MPAPLSLSISRLCTALATVWCLGCSGFEPLLSALIERHSPSACAESTMMTDASEQAASSLHTAGPSVIAADAAMQMDCNCAQSCVASSPAVIARLAPSRLPPAIASIERSQPPAIERQPSTPPPKLISA